MDTILTNILIVLKEKNISRPSLYKTLGITRQGFNSWLSGTNKGYIKKIVEIADFLGVTPEDLKKEEEEHIDAFNKTLELNYQIGTRKLMQNLSKSDIDVVVLYSKLTREHKDIVSNLINVFSNDEFVLLLEKNNHE